MMTKLKTTEFKKETKVLIYAILCFSVAWECSRDALYCCKMRLFIGELAWSQPHSRRKTKRQ